MSQEDIFYNTEGDNWFHRNSDKIKGIDDDDIVEYLKENNLFPKKILEIGCANGYRLNMCLNKFKSECFGIEPSDSAVRDGNSSYPGIKIIRGLSHDLSFFEDANFDLVIVSFVFHWIDRRYLLKTISEIDRVLTDKGLLIVRDFDPPFSCKVKYHHLPNDNVFTYKQKYSDIFCSSNLYTSIFERQFMHNKDSIGPQDRCRFVVLKKKLDLDYNLVNYQ